jgi:hypothetical protein
LDDGWKLDVQIQTFDQAQIVNMSVSKLLHMEGLEPCQLLVVADGDVVIYQRHLHVHGVVARPCGLMPWRHGGQKSLCVERHAITQRVRAQPVVRRAG